MNDRIRANINEGLTDVIQNCSEIKMIIDISKIDESKFTIKKKNDLILVNPNNNYTDWREDEIIFRSSVWNTDGELVSAGFKKFFNYGEKNNLKNQAPDYMIKGLDFINKEDGSLLICSIYKGNIIYRTRGTFDVYQFPNSNEITELRKKYNLDKYLLKINKLTDCSVLFEWNTPSNTIVIHHSEPDLKLVGVVKHEDYTYLTQEQLDDIAEVCNWKRPERYTFSSFADMFKVKDWINKEGVVMYYNNGQSMIKYKSLDYLKKHSFKSNMNYERLVDLFLEYFNSAEPHSEYLDIVKMFFQSIEQTFDFEIRKYCEDLWLKKLETAYDDYEKSIIAITILLNLFKDSDRKMKAMVIKDRLKNTIEQSIAFCLIDNENVYPKLKKLYFLNYK